MNLNSKKKILIVVPNDSLGGAEQILKMIAAHFSDESVEVLFLTKKKSTGWDLVDSHVKLTYSSSNSEYFGALGFIFAGLLGKLGKRYKYVFTSHVFVTGLVGILIRLGVIKTDFFVGRESTSIFSRFSGPKLLLYKLMYQLGYPAVDLLICQTDLMKTQLLSALPDLQNKMKIEVIPNPFELGGSRDKATDVLSENYGKYIVSAGRLIPEKGFDILINAFKGLEVQLPNLKLLILGEGSERQNLEALISQNKLENKVILMGFVANVYPFFKNAELCVVSSRVEGFPNVLLQMMSQNTSVVSTKCAGGIDQIIGIQVSGVGDVPSLLESMKKAIVEDAADKRSVFDLFLEGRSVESFIEKIEHNLA